MTAPTKLTALVALGRLAFGAGLIAAPARVASGWLGADTHQLRRWVLGAAACDLADVAIALATPSDALPANARWGTVALGGGAAAAGLLLYVALDR